MKIFSSLKNNQFVKFLLTGGIAALGNFLSRILLNIWLSFELSVIIAYFVGVTIAYILFRKVVFKKNVSIFKSWIKFIIINLIGIVLTYYLSISVYALIKNWGIFCDKEIAHIIGITVPSLFSYIGHKYFTFKE